MVTNREKNFWGTKIMAEKFHSPKMDSGWTFISRIELLGCHTHKSGQQQRNTAKNNTGYTEPTKSFQFGQKFLTKTELLNRLKHYTTETEKYTKNTIPQTGNTAKNQNTHNPPIKQQINTKLQEITYKEDFRSTQKIHRKSAGNRRRSRLWFRLRWPTEETTTQGMQGIFYCSKVNFWRLREAFDPSRPLPPPLIIGQYRIQ
jgi:hypothetical protein